jgi:hypothetical protein
MNLEDAQRKKISTWITEGLKLAEIQNRISSEFGITMTYMEVRLLVDDLKLTPKDPEPPKVAMPDSSTQAHPGPAGQSLAPKGAADPSPTPATEGSDQARPMGAVSVEVDQLARPGAVVSGKVVFGDGARAEWYLDQTGRLGLVPEQPGYRPPAADLQQFQKALETELSKIGF